ncbi:uncharacterized protein LOC100210725 isoform X2 [Hydra vulgaris]|uniref:Uncharacterized protein LOC100210725 isoform X2 n=1 Tax=Hydra vulgaris TaxID=6087 RepID=A0ABM4BSI4_HYDVU
MIQHNLCFLIFNFGLFININGFEEDECTLSKEATQNDLFQIFKNIKEEYYKNNRHMASTNDDITCFEVKKQFHPYIPTYDNIKKNADAARHQLSILHHLPINKTLLKPREERLLSQFQYFLESSFDNIYGSYYDGVWMLGPDYFCEQPICVISNHLYAALKRITVRSVKDLELIIYWIREHRKTFTQYTENAKQGIELGMVQPVEVCKSASRTLSTLYRQVHNGGPEDALNFDFATLLLGDGNILKLPYYEFITNSHLVAFRNKNNGKEYVELVKQAIIDDFGKPLKDMIDYFKNEHFKYCSPSNVSSGLGGLPLKYKFKDAEKQTQVTTHKLPTGETINVKEGYQKLMKYYTTSNITGKMATELGYKRLHQFYNEVLALGKNVTGKENEEEIIEEFKKKLNKKSLYFNAFKFPDNESDDIAHEKCVNDKDAAELCPTRWKAIKSWFEHNVNIMQSAKSCIQELFYTNGENKTTPDCLVKLTAEYNPSNGVPSYLESDPDCIEPANYFVPFFKAEMGPSYEDYNTNFHESRPGHHLQIQGFLENFQDACGGISGWINDVVDYYPSFSEGWGLYAENPLLLHDTKIIKDNPLARYGTLKWQIWRALRLIADVGFHEGNLTRDDVTKLFSKYTWDESDTVIKEITRYQGTPGQATSYMIGQQTIIDLRSSIEKQLGDKFDIKEFHYQLLKQGQSPFHFILSYMASYVKCKLDKSSLSDCNVILNPPKPSFQFVDIKRKKKLKDIKALFRLFKKKKHH